MAAWLSPTDPMSLIGTVAEQMQRQSLATAFPACCQANGTLGAGVYVAWKTSQVPQKLSAQAPEEQLSGMKLGGTIANSGLLVVDPEVQSAKKISTTLLSQPRVLAPVSPTGQTLPISKGASCTRLSRVSEDIAPHQQQDLTDSPTHKGVVLGAKDVSGFSKCHQSVGSPVVVSVPASTNGIDLIQDDYVKLMTALQSARIVVQQTQKNPRARSDVDGPYTAELVKKRRRLAWTKTTSPLSEPSSTPGIINPKLAVPYKPASCTTGPRWWRRARLSQEALVRRQLFVMGLQRQQVELQGAVVDQAGSRQLEEGEGHVGNNRAKPPVESQKSPQNDIRSRLSDTTPRKSQAISDPAAHLVAARAKISSRPSICPTYPGLPFGRYRNAIPPFRLRRSPANSSKTARQPLPIPPPYSLPSASHFPLCSPSSVGEEIDSEEEDEDELAFPTSKHESRYLASDYEDDGVEIYADLARLWPEPGDGMQTDDEYEGFGAFGFGAFA